MNDYARHEHHDFLNAARQALADPPLQAAIDQLAFDVVDRSANRSHV